MDFLAFLIALNECNKFETFPQFESVKIFSNYGSWKHTLKLMQDFIVSGSLFPYPLKKVDVQIMKVIQWDYSVESQNKKLMSCISESDVVLMVKTLNLLTPANDVLGLSSMLLDMLKMMKPQSLLFCIDTKPSIALILENISKLQGKFLYQPIHSSCILPVDFPDHLKETYGCLPVLSTRVSFFVWQKSTNQNLVEAPLNYTLPMELQEDSSDYCLPEISNRNLSSCSPETSSTCYTLPITTTVNLSNCLPESSVHQKNINDLKLSIETESIFQSYQNECFEAQNGKSVLQISTLNIETINGRVENTIGDYAKYFNSKSHPTEISDIHQKLSENFLDIATQTDPEIIFQNPDYCVQSTIKSLTDQIAQLVFELEKKKLPTKKNKIKKKNPSPNNNSSLENQMITIDEKISQTEEVFSNENNINSSFDPEKNFLQIKKKKKNKNKKNPSLNSNSSLENQMITIDEKISQTEEVFSNENNTNLSFEKQLFSHLEQIPLIKSDNSCLENKRIIVDTKFSQTEEILLPNENNKNSSLIKQPFSKSDHTYSLCNQKESDLSKFEVVSAKAIAESKEENPSVSAQGVHAPNIHGSETHANIDYSMPCANAATCSFNDHLGNASNSICSCPCIANRKTFVSDSRLQCQSGYCHHCSEFYGKKSNPTCPNHHTTGAIEKPPTSLISGSNSYLPGPSIVIPLQNLRSDVLSRIIFMATTGTTSEK